MPPRCTKATIGVASIDDQFARSGHNISGLFGVRSVDGQIHGQFGYVTKHGEALPAQITTQPGRGTEVPFFRVVFRYLAIAALSFSRVWAAAPKSKKWVSPLDHGKTTLMRRSLIMRWGGPRSETTQFMSEVDMFLTGKSPKCLRLWPLVSYPRLCSDGALQTAHDIWENWTAGASHAGDSFSLGL